MQQPGAVFYVRFVRLIVRLITAAGQLFSVSKLHRKSKLLCLRRMNIEKRRFMPEDFFFLSVLHLDQMQLFVQKSGMLSGRNVFVRSRSKVISSSCAYSVTSCVIAPFVIF